MVTGMTNLGGNIFAGVEYPLVLVDRYFRPSFDLDQAAFVYDVFRWDSATGDVTYEVRAGIPQADGIDLSPNGTVTVAASDGGFQYKIRSGGKNRSELFGSIPAGEEVIAKISDTSITVWRGKSQLGTIQDNMISGFPVGLLVMSDGGVAIGSGLPEGFVSPPGKTYTV